MTTSMSTLDARRSTREEPPLTLVVHRAPPRDLDDAAAGAQARGGFDKELRLGEGSVGLAIRASLGWAGGMRQAESMAQLTERVGWRCR